MNIQDLKDKWTRSYVVGSSPTLIAHKNMKTVKFWPTNLDEDENHYKLYGYWYCNQTEDLLVQEQIKIKKADLNDWFICES